MNRYNLRILTYTGSYEETIKAKTFASAYGFYQFKSEDGSTVACYPVDKTIIESVEYNCDRL